MDFAEQGSKPEYGTKEYWTWREVAEVEKIKAATARACAQEKHRREQDTDNAAQKLGQVVILTERKPQGSLRLEQNLGCELPVCVSNRRHVNAESIRFATDEGLEWKLTRAADTKLPGPEAYKYWLWFLDRCHRAKDQGATLAPRIALNPAELSRLFGIKADGRWYEDIDEAFTSFSRTIVSAHTVFYRANKRMESDTTLGTLCFYSSWKDAGCAVGGWIAPGPLLWSSIQQSYLLSVDFDRLRRLESYIAQRLYTHLSKHCRPSGTYTVSLRKLLPKLPMNIRLESATSALKPHHEALTKAGFLSAAPRYVGRGQSRQVVYQRA